MARVFGGTSADFTVGIATVGGTTGVLRLSPGQRFSVWTGRTSGVQVLDVTDGGGAPLPGGIGTSDPVSGLITLVDPGDAYDELYVQPLDTNGQPAGDRTQLPTQGLAQRVKALEDGGGDPGGKSKLVDLLDVTAADTVEHLAVPVRDADAGTFALRPLDAGDVGAVDSAIRDQPGGLAGLDGFGRLKRAEQRGVAVFAGSTDAATIPDNAVQPGDLWRRPASSTGTAPAVVATPSARTTSSQGSLQLPIPGAADGAAAGQRMLAVGAIRVNGSWEAVPTGWLGAAGFPFAGTNKSMRAIHKALAAADLGAGVLLDPAVTNAIAAAGFVCSGVHATTPLDVAPAVAEGTAFNEITIPGLTTVTPNCRLLAFAVQLKPDLTQPNFTDPGGWAEGPDTFAHQGTNGMRLKGWHKAQASAGPTGGLVIATSGNSPWIGAMFALRPA